MSTNPNQLQILDLIMRQVPTYLIIGNGRLARHFHHYFQLLGIPAYQWYRQNAQPLNALLKQCSHILLLITDQAIETFITAHPELKDKVLIHCSGSLVTPLATSAHPLMTFSNELYQLDKYQRITFIYEAEGPDFKTLFPNLPNPHFPLSRNLKSHYHALCVLANNFTTLLWQKFFADLENKCQVPAAAGKPFLQQTLENLQNNLATALTGPLARQDTETINKNLKALADDPYMKVYKAFVQAYENNKVEL